MHPVQRLLLLVVVASVLLPAAASGPAASEPTPARQAGGGYGTWGDACGALIRKTSTTYWSCTFVDHFNGSALNPYKWGVTRTGHNGFTSGGECFVNSPDNVSVAFGLLRLTARRTPRPFTCASPRGSFTTQYTGGMVSTWAKFGQTYGRFEIRARFPGAKVPGLHSALWLYPVEPNRYGAWPASGEIDIAEFFTRYPARVVPYVHYNGDKDDPNATTNTCVVAHPEKFHTYVVEWTRSAITMKYDGKVCLRDFWKPLAPQVKPQPFDHPFTINLTQALGLGANRVTASTPLPATMVVDRVRVWR